MFRVFIAGLTLSGFSACATQSTPIEASSATQVQSERVASMTGLPAQTLAPNECGLFLWSKTDTSKFIFFAKAGTREALFLFEGLATQLRPVSEGGEIFGQFYTDTSYATEAGREVLLSYDIGETLTDGARISNGTVQFEDEKGWRTVLPVLGVRACQPAIQNDVGSVSSSSNLR